MRELVAERERLLAEARKLTDREIAAKFEVHPNTVWKVCKRDSWVHV
jgi:DNA-binding transcriptional regulator YhcF (GntR family)